MDPASIERGYASARERYARLGVDADRALGALRPCALALRCRKPEVGASRQGPADPRSVAALRSDLHQAFALIPGRHRLDLDAGWAEAADGPVEPNALEPANFRGWLEWARHEGLRIDLRSACHAHPMADSGFTLSHREKEVRKFWVEHVRRCRKVGAFIGREMKTPCLHTLCVPDGSPTHPFDRWAHREILRESLDEVYEAEHSPSQMRDALEGPAPQAAEEICRVASHEFVMGYAMSRGKIVGLDLGRPAARAASDKVSAILQFSDLVLLHLGRPIPWDDARADLLDSGMPDLAREIIRGDALQRVRIGLEASGSSRTGSWAAAARATLMAMLVGLLEPAGLMKELEARGDEEGVRALAAELEALPYRAVWDFHCLRSGVPPSGRWRQAVEEHESKAASGGR